MESHVGRTTILPYGETLHYNDCGCPEFWVPGTRAADMVDLLAQVKPELDGGRMSGRDITRKA